MDEHDGHGYPHGGEGKHAQRARAELLLDAALLKKGEPKARLDHALLCSEAVDGDDLGAADPNEGETALERRGIWLSRGAWAGRKGDPALSGQGARVHAPSAREPMVSPADGEHGLVVDARGYQLRMRVHFVAEAEGGITSTDQLAHFPAEGRPHAQIDAWMEL